MPEFDTQRPQEPNEPSKLRTLLRAHKHRILLIVNNLRSVLMANWLRTVLISLGVFFFVMVVVPGGLLIYQYSGLSDQLSRLLADKQAERGETVTCDERYLSQSGWCVPPHAPKYSVVCGGKSRDLVIPAAPGEGTCLDAGEWQRSDCRGGGVWVYETGECIPDAKTVMCEVYTQGSALGSATASATGLNDCTPPSSGEPAV
jgi:hypothetical protein